MSGKTFYFETLSCKEICKFFFSFCKVFPDVRFFIIHYFKVKNIIKGLIQFTCQKTGNKARTYFLDNGMTNKQLKSVSKDIPRILIQMKVDRVKLKENIFWHEYGELCIGGGYIVDTNRL